MACDSTSGPRAMAGADALVSDFSETLSGPEVVRKEDGGPTSEFTETSREVVLAAGSLLGGAFSEEADGDGSGVIGGGLCDSKSFSKSDADCCFSDSFGGVGGIFGSAVGSSKTRRVLGVVSGSIFFSATTGGVSSFNGSGVDFSEEVIADLSGVSSGVVWGALAAGFGVVTATFSTFAFLTIGLGVGDSLAAVFSFATSRFEAALFSASLRFSVIASGGTSILSGAEPRAQPVTRSPSTK